MPAVPAQRRRVDRSILVAAVVAACAGLASRAEAIVWRENLSDAIVQNLSAQPQFNGVGIISAPNGSGTGTAIAPGWILTAKHVVGDGQRIRFNLPGGVFNGTSIGDPNSDLALVRLDANSQMPSTYNFITPNADRAVVGKQVWTVGNGGAGPVSQSANGGANLNYNFVRRAGTNVVDSVRDTVYGPNSLVFSQSNTAAGSTKYEVSTAPGDSGGPMFLQSGNQWFLAGTTFGAVGGVGFVDANAAPRYSAFITANTGDIFTPRAAATSLNWDATNTNGSADGGTGSWNLTDTNFFDGKYNFAWDNGLAESAVFANAAGSVNVDDNLVFGGLVFNAVSANAYQLKAGSGTLAPAASGGTVTANAYARLNASLTGSGTLGKNGTSAIELDGDNSAYNGRINVDAGTLIVETAESFGTGGFDTSKATFVAGGATLQLRPNSGVNNGFGSGEHLHVAGGGAGGNGAIYASGNGAFTLTERVALDADATVKVDAGSSLTVGGTQGRFYNGNTLTKIGNGLLVLDASTPNLVTALNVNAGTLAGRGEVRGALTINSGATLAPGDTAAGGGLGTFTTGNLTLTSGGDLAIALDPAAGSGDLLNVFGTASLGGGDLLLSLLSQPTAGQSFLILANDGTDPITGLFAQGSLVSASFGGTGYDFLINYAGGTGNDVVLTYAVPEPTTLGLLGIAGLALLRRRRA